MFLLNFLGSAFSVLTSALCCFHCVLYVFVLPLFLIFIFSFLFLTSALLHPLFSLLLLLLFFSQSYLDCSMYTIAKSLQEALGIMHGSHSLLLFLLSVHTQVALNYSKS